MIRSSFLSCLLACSLNVSHSQWVTPCQNTLISSFPYVEDFESDNGGWLSFGGDQWSWGTPTKTLLNRAGGGLKCWARSLSGLAYPGSVVADLMSPCFDISSLQNPQVSFKLFWDTQKGFDGLRFHYSVNGSSYPALGTQSSVGCNGTNWYNGKFVWDSQSGVLVDGWTGNTRTPATSCPPQSGGGSGGWVTVRHTLNIPGIVGQSKIRFMFMFLANDNCNGFDGVAIDDFRIEEAPTQLAIENSCINNFERSFISNGFCLTNPSWNFGDPSSGSENVSNLPNPRHRFTAAGNYTVTLSGIDNSGVTVQAFQSITVIDTDTSISWPGACSSQPNGTLSIIASGSASGYLYNWNTTPPQTGPTITNVGPGLYISTVTAANACPVIDSFDLRENSSTIDLGDDIDICPGQTITLNAGNFSAYSWQDGSTNSSFVVNAAGAYHVTVTSNGGCVLSDTINVTMECRNVYFPSAFTPNGDGLNDFFGAAGNLTGLQNYSLTVFDRYSNKVFFTNDPFKKWDGTIKGKKYNTGSFVWYSEFVLNGRREQRKGSLLLLH